MAAGSFSRRKRGRRFHLPILRMTPTQLPNESARAFAAFKRYVEMGHKRSLVKLGRKLGISRQAVEQLSKRYHWQKRLRELELEDCKRAVKADEQAKLDAAKQLEAERSEFRRRAIAASRRATERALQILEQPLGRSRPSDAACHSDSIQLLNQSSASCFTGMLRASNSKRTRTNFSDSIQSFAGLETDWRI